jgi:hypothetical protein
VVTGFARGDRISRERENTGCYDEDFLEKRDFLFKLLIVNHNFVSKNSQ